jgi:hypothetical protein
MVAELTMFLFESLENNGHQAISVKPRIQGSSTTSQIQSQEQERTRRSQNQEYLQLKDVTHIKF